VASLPASRFVQQTRSPLEFCTFRAQPPEWHWWRIVQHYSEPL